MGTSVKSDYVHGLYFSEKAGLPQLGWVIIHKPAKKDWDWLDSVKKEEIDYSVKSCYVPYFYFIDLFPKLISCLSLLVLLFLLLLLKSFF